MQRPSVDIEAVANRRKQQWIASARKTVSVQERIALSVPWWLIIIAAGLFALSAGHTAGVFNKLSPIGYAGPFVVEFALLWAAFARVSARSERGGISVALRSLEVLAFIMAIGANAIGAITRVTELTGINNLSFSNIISQYGTLPIATQTEILFVPLFALFIPIGTWVAGEGLADLFLKQRKSGGMLEEKWREVEQEEMRRALYAEYVRNGFDALDANRQASALSTGMIGGRVRALSRGTEIRALPDTQAVSAAELSEAVRTVSRTDTGQGGDNARTVVRKYLQDNPEAVNLSVRKLADAAGVGRTIAHEVQREFKATDGNA